MINTILQNKTNYIFISPHLDDAIFSCGGLIDSLHKKGKKITIVNVFTKASKKPYTISINKFLKSCGYNDADKLYRDRIEEDKKVAQSVNAKVINLNFTDALWRRKNANWPIPELNYVYPIFRLTIAKGFISKYDNDLMINLEKRLKKIINEDQKTVIFCPSGIGNHTDHIITRNVVNKIFNNIVFWEDYPYTNTHQLNNDFYYKNNLKKDKLIINVKNKSKLVYSYKSQLNAIFGDLNPKLKQSESYFLKNFII